MGDPLLDRQACRWLAVLRHAEEATGNAAMTCRYFGISRPRPGTNRVQIEPPDTTKPTSTATTDCDLVGDSG
jgi:hypothetical protein